MMKQFSILAVVVFLLSGCSDAVYFRGISDGDSVSSPFTVKMSVCGMDVQEAGDVVEGAGHHHLIVDGDCIAKGETVPKDSNHIHFGKGQTDAMLNLKPGDHSLTLQFANGIHASYGKEMCKTIKITVE